MKAKGYRSVGMVLAVATLLSVATYAERGGVRLPAAVRKALQKLYPGATVEEAVSETEGMRVYEVELEQGERDLELTVAPNGTVLEVETEIALEELPEPVKAALRRAADGARIEEVSKEVTHWVVTLKKLETPEVSYEAEVVKDGREMELEFAADGTLLQEDDADEDDDADHDDDDEDDDEDEEHVSLDEVPRAVRAAIRKRAKGAEIEEIERETEDGKTVYEAVIELRISPDGKVLGPEEEDEDDDGHDEEDEDEERVSLDDVPRAVRATIQKHARGAEIEEIERETERGKTVYEAAIELRFSPDGKVLGPGKDEDDDEEEDEERVSLDEVPRAVRATIQKRAKGAEIEEIERETEGGETVYEAVIELRISPDGKVLGPEKEDEDDDNGDKEEDEDEERVALDDIPKAVRAVIMRYAKRAEIEEIERETENGKTVYEAAIELRISANGKILGPEKDDEDDDD